MVLTDGQSEILVASRQGKVVRFGEETVRAMGRDTSGVRAITLEENDDAAIGMVCVSKGTDETVLVISEKGYGKRTALDDENGEPIYRITFIILDTAHKHGSSTDAVVGKYDKSAHHSRHPKQYACRNPSPK